MSIIVGGGGWAARLSEVARSLLPVVVQVFRAWYLRQTGGCAAFPGRPREDEGAETSDAECGAVTSWETALARALPSLRCFAHRVADGDEPVEDSGRCGCGPSSTAVHRRP
jgi:hypothetical protein